MSITLSLGQARPTAKGMPSNKCGCEKTHIIRLVCLMRCLIDQTIQSSPQIGLELVVLHIYGCGRYLHYTIVFMWIFLCFRIFSLLFKCWYCCHVKQDQLHLRISSTKTDGIQTSLAQLKRGAKCFSVASLAYNNELRRSEKMLITFMVQCVN